MSNGTGEAFLETEDQLRCNRLIRHPQTRDDAARVFFFFFFEVAQPTMGPLVRHELKY